MNKLEEKNIAEANEVKEIPFHEKLNQHIESQEKTQEYKEEPSEVISQYENYRQDVINDINGHKALDNKAFDSTNYGAYEQLYQAEKLGFIDRDLLHKQIGTSAESQAKMPEANRLHEVKWKMINNNHALYEGVYDSYNDFQKQMIAESNMDKVDYKSDLYNEVKEELKKGKENRQSKLEKKYSEYSSLFKTKNYDSKYFRKEAIDEIKKGQVYPILTNEGRNLVDMHDAGLINMEDANQPGNINKFERENLYTDHRNKFLEDVNKLRSAYSVGKIKDRPSYLKMVKKTYLEHQKTKEKNEKMKKTQENIAKHSKQKEVPKANESPVKEKFDNSAVAKPTIVPKKVEIKKPKKKISFARKLWNIFTTGSSIG